MVLLISLKQVCCIQMLTQVNEKMVPNKQTFFIKCEKFFSKISKIQMWLLIFKFQRQQRQQLKLDFMDADIKFVKCNYSGN